MDWKEHMRNNVRNWLLEDSINARLNKNFLLPFGNPYLFQKSSFFKLFDNIEQIGLFYNATYEQNPVSFTQPLFGGPMISMYVEMFPDLGVKNIIACGYVGGLSENIEIGSYVVPMSAYGTDGFTRSYYRTRKIFPSSGSITQVLCETLRERHAKFKQGVIVSIDVLLLEDDALIEHYKKKGFCAIDLETACFYALGLKLGLNVSAIHIVTDNLVVKVIDPGRYHEASLSEQFKWH